MAKKMDLTDMLKAGYISQDEYNRIVEKTDPSKPKRAEVVADYQRYLIEKGYAERIAQHYSSAVNSFLEWLRDFSAERGITIETWNDININYVNAYLFSLVAKDVKKTYLDKQSRGLTQFFEKLKNDRLTDVNSKDILISSLLMPDNSGTNALTNDEIERIMAANDYKGKVLILLAYECMLKANEICRVCFSDFDLENKILTVYGNDDRTQIKKTIEISERLANWIVEHQKQQYEDKRDWDLRRINDKTRKLLPLPDTDYVFQSYRGTTTTIGILRFIIKSTASNYYTGQNLSSDDENKLIDGFTIELLRNSRRCYLYHQGYSIQDVAKMLDEKSSPNSYKLQKFAEGLYGK